MCKKLRAIGCFKLSILIINTTIEWNPNPSAINSLVEINLASLSLSGLHFLYKLCSKHAETEKFCLIPLYAMHILDFRNDPYAVPNKILIGFLTSSYKVVLHRLINYSGVDRMYTIPNRGNKINRWKEKKSDNRAFLSASIY